MFISKQHYNSSTLGVVTQAKIPDLLKGHPEGVHVSELAEATKIDQGKLSRVLRFLVTKHVFKEGKRHSMGFLLL